jgi:putative sterol carrier protein
MALTIPEIMSKMPRAFPAEQAVDLSAVVHFKFTGAEAGEWNAVIKDGKCDVAQGIPHSRPTMALTADSSDFLKIVSGELDAMKAFMEGRIKLVGDIGLATKLVQLLKT